MANQSIDHTDSNNSLLQVDLNGVYSVRRKGLTEFSLSYQPSFNWRGYRNDHAYTDLKLEPGTAGGRHMDAADAWKDEDSGIVYFV